MRIHLNIGSNQGDREASICRAIALLAQSLSPCKIYLSDYIESEPWGFDSDNKFINRGILVLKDDGPDPFELLDLTQQIEKIIGGNAPHRNADGSYRDRAIDIDIIDIDNIRIDSPRLMLPHPYCEQREFVRIPRNYLDSISS